MIFVVRSSWARSGAARGKESTRSGRPPGSWSAAVARARREWDALAGGPDRDLTHGDRAVGNYSDVAAAAILRLAVALWPSVAAEMAQDAADD